jgi:hypothetical protein
LGEVSNCKDVSAPGKIRDGIGVGPSGCSGRPIDKEVVGTRPKLFYSANDTIKVVFRMVCR